MYSFFFFRFFGSVFFQLFLELNCRVGVYLFLVVFSNYRSSVAWTFFAPFSLVLCASFRFSAQVLVFKEGRGPKNTWLGLDEVMFST